MTMWNHAKFLRFAQGNRRNEYYGSWIRQDSERTEFWRIQLRSVLCPFLPSVLALCLALLQWNAIAVNVSAQPDESKVGEKSNDQRQQDRRQVGAQSRGPGRKGNGGKGGGSGLGNYTEPPPANNVPEHLYNILLGRPSDSSITIRALFHKEAKVFVEYGLESGKQTLKTPVANIAAKTTSDFDLRELKGNSRYYYKLVYRVGSGEEQSSDEYTFKRNEPRVHRLRLALLRIRISMKTRAAKSTCARLPTP